MCFFYPPPFSLQFTVVEALIRSSDVHNQQVIRIRTKVLHKIKSRREEKVIGIVPFMIYHFKNKSRLVLMGTVPEQHCIYTSWHFAVTIKGDDVAGSDCHLQCWYKSLIIPAGKNSWNKTPTKMMRIEYKYNTSTIADYCSAKQR